MGAIVISSIEEQAVTDLLQLPEGCIANLLSLTSPKDACRLSLLCKIFRSAAESDTVWNKFLCESETHNIISQSGSLAAGNKKELFLMLNHFLIKKGKLSFSLDKWTGKKCYMICARELGIVWGDTPSYWKWNSHPESRFEEVAELRNGCWFEISGKLETRLLSPSTLYQAYLVFKFAPHAYGFRKLTAEVSVGLVGGEHRYQTVSLHYEGKFNGKINHDGGWWEIKLGEVFCEGEEDRVLSMHCLANGAGNWKSGLIVQGIEVRPTRNN